MNPIHVEELECGCVVSFYEDRTHSTDKSKCRDAAAVQRFLALCGAGLGPDNQKEAAAAT